jgi:hypothetical protein
MAKLYRKIIDGYMRFYGNAYDAKCMGIKLYTEDQVKFNDAKAIKPEVKKVEIVEEDKPKKSKKNKEK